MHFVILGGSKGLGASMTAQLVRRGHVVTVGARDVSRVPVHERVAPFVADAGDYADIVRLSGIAAAEFGAVDGWINCQGVSGGFGDFGLMCPDAMATVATSNLLGTLNGSRRALELFADRGVRGHLFNVTGAGFDFRSTPGFAAYGATKAGVTQLTKTLRAENPAHGVHLVNPGMMTTELLYEGLPPQIRERVDLLAEDPEVVAGVLVPKMLAAVHRGSRGMTINYMTMRRVMNKMSRR